MVARRPFWEYCISIDIQRGGVGGTRDLVEVVFERNDDGCGNGESDRPPRSGGPKSIDRADGSSPLRPPLRAAILRPDLQPPPAQELAGPGQVVAQEVH